MCIAGVDPRFPVGGGANPPGGVRQHTNLPDFPKKLHEIKKILVCRGGMRREYPPWIRHCIVITFLLRPKPVSDLRRSRCTPSPPVPYPTDQILLNSSGGSRISPRRGRQLSGEVPTYDFAKFSQKTVWNWKNLGPQGGVHQKFKNVDPPLNIFQTCWRPLSWELLDRLLKTVW